MIAAMNTISTRVQDLRSSRTFILVTVCVAIFNDVFLFGTIIPALPFALPDRVGIEDHDVQIWIAVLLAAYGGALLVGSLLFGWIGDKLPRKGGIFLFGIVCLLIATLLLSIGQHIALMIVGRVFQGLAAAIVWTSGLALLTDVFGQGRYGEAVGYGQTSVSIGTTSAPLLGGVAYHTGGYSAVSAMSLSLVAFSLILALLMVEPAAAPTHHVQDPPRYPVIQVSNTDGLERQSSHPDLESANDRSPLLWKTTSTQVEKRTEGRPVYHILLRSPRVLAAMGGIFTYSFVIISFEGLIPLFVKEAFHWNALYAALTFLSWIAPSMLGPVAGRASDRVGPRWIAVGGFLFAVAPLILLRLVTKNTTAHQVLMCALLTCVGLGLVWVMPACISDLTLAAADLKRSHPDSFGKSGARTQAFGLFVFAYSCGVFLGPAVSGVMKAYLSWGAATLIMACVCLGACVPIALQTSAKGSVKEFEIE